MFISWAAVSRSSSWGILVSLLLDSGHLPIVTFLSSPLQSQPHVVTFGRSLGTGRLGRKEASLPSSFLCSPCESASLLLLFTCKGARAPGMSFSCAYVATHPRHVLTFPPTLHSEPPLAASVRPLSTGLGPWIFQREISLPI